MGHEALSQSRFPPDGAHRFYIEGFWIRLRFENLPFVYYPVCLLHKSWKCISTLVFLKR